MNFEITFCKCPECNKNFPIPRKKAHKRANGHVKDIYCPFCKKVNKMTQDDLLSK